jgi:hypothetical protein
MLLPQAVPRRREIVMLDRHMNLVLEAMLQERVPQQDNTQRSRQRNSSKLLVDMDILRNNHLMAFPHSLRMVMRTLPARVATSSRHMVDKEAMIHHSRATLLLRKALPACSRVCKALHSNSRRWAWEANLHNPRNHPAHSYDSIRYSQWTSAYKASPSMSRTLTSRHHRSSFPQM